MPPNDYTTAFNPDKHVFVARILGSGHGPGVFVPFEILQLTGDPATAIILSQMLYWFSKMGREFYKSDASWCEELHLSRNVVRRVIHGDKRSENGNPSLKDFGIEVTVKRANGAPTSHYRINYDRLEAYLNERFSSDPLSAMQTNDCMQCRQSITEEYTETTLYKSTDAQSAPTAGTQAADAAPRADKPEIDTSDEKPNHKQMTAAVLEAFEVIAPTGADYGKAGKVAKELRNAGLALSDVPALVQFVRVQAAGKWKVTMTSIITNGRVSEYIRHRDTSYTIVESDNNDTGPMNMNVVDIDDNSK